jgi:hypothetical protein
MPQPALALRSRPLVKNATGNCNDFKTVQGDYLKIPPQIHRMNIYGPYDSIRLSSSNSKAVKTTRHHTDDSAAQLVSDSSRQRDRPRIVRKRAPPRALSESSLLGQAEVPIATLAFAMRIDCNHRMYHIRHRNLRKTLSSFTESPQSTPPPHG